MSVLDSNINVPLPEAADWWYVGLRFNSSNIRPFIPDDSINHCGDIVGWTGHIRRKIITSRCNSDAHMFTYICESIIKSELIDVKDVQIGWPVIRDNRIVYTIMVVTNQRNKESVGIIEIKTLR